MKDANKLQRPPRKEKVHSIRDQGQLDSSHLFFKKIRTKGERDNLVGMTQTDVDSMHKYILRFSC